jgi:hypothetical protein
MSAPIGVLAYGEISPLLFVSHPHRYIFHLSEVAHARITRSISRLYAVTTMVTAHSLPCIHLLTLLVPELSRGCTGFYHEFI